MAPFKIIAMTALSVILVILSLAATVTLAAQSTCQNTIHCPCGNTGKNTTVCVETNVSDNELCKKWSRCKSCQDGLNKCLQCGDGYEGPFCSDTKRQTQKFRQKRQYYPVYSRTPQRQRSRFQNVYQNPAQQSASYYCSNLDSPKLGNIRCEVIGPRRTCVGRCLPGYSFENFESVNEITLKCEGGVWSPLNVFPNCKSKGQCDLVVQMAGSFNCTTGMEGTRCDVNCANRYAGRYFCFPGQGWDPPLPRCVRPKEIPDDRQTCRCEYGASCDSRGNCVCPVGRTGTLCEIIVPDETTCPDPGFISNGFRRHSDGSESNTRRSFEEGDVLVYGCQSNEFALQGSSLITCESDGTWSNPLPKCIRSVVSPEVICPDPGQVANADRMNSDGTPSAGVQQYEVGQSVVYSCRPGFALQRRSLITCLASGRWSSRTPSCTRITPPNPTIQTTTEEYCQDLGVDPNGSRRPRLPPNRRGFPRGSRVEHFCNDGFDLSGERSIFCLASAKWSSGRPRCKEQSRTSDVAYCLNPGSITNGKAVYYPSLSAKRGTQTDELDPEYPEGSRLHYSCNSGYTLEGSASLTCSSSGSWSAERPICREEAESSSYCRNPGPIPNGQVVHMPSLNRRTHRPSSTEDMEEQYPQGSRLQYSCDDGYTLEGSDTLSCGPSGSWSAHPPICINIQGTNTMFCDNPGIISNGNIRVVSSAVGPRSRPSGITDDVDFPEATRLEYSCDDGFILQGSQSLRCQLTGFWSSDPPTCIPDCGRSFTQTSRRILHGEKTFSGEWPWVVAISIQENNTTRLICGGAVLNSRTVMTAAHCLTEASIFTLYFGKLHRRDKDDDSEVLVRRSTQIIIYPDFNNSTLDSDIGLVKFQPRIRFSVRVQPICLPSSESTAKNIMTGSPGYVTGWGLTERHLPAEDLLLAQLPVLTNEDCMESYRKQNLILPLTRSMFCAGFPDAQQSACSGDSGSPLVFYDSIEKRYTVEGIVSFGAEGQCGLPGRYTVFTKVFHFVPWILRNL